MLIVALASCPIVGVEGDGTVLHRVEMDGIDVNGWGTSDARLSTAVCGTPVRLFDREGAAVRWPDVRTRGTGYRRCPACAKWRRP